VFFLQIFLAFNHIGLSCGIYITITLGLIHEDEHGTNAKRLKLRLQLCKEPILHQVYIAEGNSAKQLTISQLANTRKDFDNA